MFLRPWRPLVPSFSTVLWLEVEENEGERTIVLIHSAAPSPVVVPDKELATRDKQQEKVRLLYMSRILSPCTWLYDLGSLTSKRKRCSLLKLLLVKLSSPGLRLVVVVALSLMSTSLQRNVSCSSLASHAYASFPTTRTETQPAGIVVWLKEQQNNLFSHHCPLRPPKISKLFRQELRRRCIIGSAEALPILCVSDFCE